MEDSGPRSATRRFSAPGLYVDGDVGAAGSTGRGEANLYNLWSFLIVEEMRRGAHPKDAGMTALKRIKANTIEKRLLNGRGDAELQHQLLRPQQEGQHAGVAMYRRAERDVLVLRRERAEDGPDGTSPAGSGDGLKRGFH